MPLAVICSPRSKGGLGLLPLLAINVACLFKQVWAIVAGVDNIWIEWIKSRYLRGKSLWDTKLRSKAS